VEDVSVASGRPPEVTRPGGSTALFLTFRGSREQKGARQGHAHQNRAARPAGRSAVALDRWRILGKQRPTIPLGVGGRWHLSCFGATIPMLRSVALALIGVSVIAAAAWYAVGWLVPIVHGLAGK
jgi:hypothetical protein